MAKKYVQHREYVTIDSNTPFVLREAYQALRTNLMFILGAKNTNRIVFTSANAAEGKTSTCANIAISFAQTGARVLLIDADMRKPKLHRIFQCNMGSGMSELLCGIVEDNSIQKTSHENLFLMTAGRIPPNPADLLVSSNMDKVLATVSNSFDYVFIDAPPVGVVTDAAIIAGKLGGAILIVRRGVTRTENVQAAKEALEQAGTEVIGYIMTDVDRATSSYRRYGNKYGNDGYYYSDQSASGEKKR